MTYTKLLALDNRSPAPNRVPVSQHDAIDGTTRSIVIEAKQPRKHDTMPPRDHDTKNPLPDDDLVARLHGAVKQVGKEAATYRFHRREKSRLVEVVYRYGRRGYRTSENQVVRIAVNWMLAEYRAKGKASLLHRVLRALYG